MTRIIIIIIPMPAFITSSNGAGIIQFRINIIIILGFIMETNLI